MISGGRRLLPLTAGSWQQKIEERGTAILKTDRELRGKAHSDRQDWFTEEQFTLRRDREVYSGHPIDPLVESGLYRRAYNPQIGKRPTRRGRYSNLQDPWHQDGYESFDWTGDVAIPSWSRLVDRIVLGGQHYTWDIMLPHTAPRVGLQLSDR